MNTGVIYQITSPKGNSYIGKTVDFERRIRSHQNPSSTCTALLRAIQKYGWVNMKVEVLHTDVPLKDLAWLERHCIWINGTMSPHGYNLTAGGEGGSPSEETRAKQSATQRAKAERGELETQRPEVRAKISSTLLLLAERNEHPSQQPESRAKNSLTHQAMADRGENPAQRPEVGAKISYELRSLAERNEHPSQQPESRAKRSATQRAKAERGEHTFQQPEVKLKIQKTQSRKRRERKEEGGQTYLLDEEI